MPKRSASRVCSEKGSSFIVLAIIAVHLAGSFLYLYVFMEPAMAHLNDLKTDPPGHEFGVIESELSDDRTAKSSLGWKQALNSDPYDDRSGQLQRSLGTTPDALAENHPAALQPQVGDVLSKSFDRLDSFNRLEWVIQSSKAAATTTEVTSRAVATNPSLPSSLSTSTQIAEESGLTGAAITPRPSAQRRRPNILFLMSDDHSAEAVGFRGARARLGALAGTTHIDRLASQGAYVEDMFVSLSLCSPSRATLLTGLHAHGHGVTELSGSMRSEVNQGATYVDELVARGYRSALVGKWHLENRPSSFQQFSAFVKQGSYRNPFVVTQADKWTQTPGAVKRATGHCSKVVASTAIRYMQAWSKSGVGTVDDEEEEDNRGGGEEKGNRDSEKEEERPPFVLHVHFKETHEPWNYPELYEKSLDDVWRAKLAQRRRQKTDENGAVIDDDEVAGPWHFPEPSTLMDPHPRGAGPSGALPYGWPLEELGDRIVELQDRAGQMFGQSRLNATLFQELVAEKTNDHGVGGGGEHGRSDRGGNPRGSRVRGKKQARRLVHSKLVADYLRAGKAMDDSIGSVLGVLDDLGYTNDTLVVYTSDQGYFLGEHNGFDKRFMWEESIRVPCVLRYPREIIPGTVVGSGLLISNTDWAPTLLDFANVRVTHYPYNPQSSAVELSSKEAVGGIRGDFASSIVSQAQSRLQARTTRSKHNDYNDKQPTLTHFHGRSFRPLLIALASFRQEPTSQLPPTPPRSIATPQTAVTRGSGFEGGSSNSNSHVAAATSRWWGRDSIYYRYYGDPKKPLMRPGHMGLRTANGFKLVLYFDLRCFDQRWEQQQEKVGGGMARPQQASAAAIKAGPWELYDLWADPLESVNLFPVLRKHNATLVRALQQLLNVEVQREGFESNPSPQKRHHSRSLFKVRSKVSPRLLGMPKGCTRFGFDSDEFLACLTEGCSQENSLSTFKPSSHVV